MTTIYLSQRSSISCKPAVADTQEQGTFQRVFITLLENVPGEHITMSPLLEDHRTADLTAITANRQFIFRPGDTWDFPLGNSGLSVTVMLLGWTQDRLQEAVLEVYISPVDAAWLVEYRARKGYV